MAVIMVDGGIVLPDGSVIGQGLGTNTIMPFVQPTAPIGWTKSTSHNNKTLRVVSGSAGSGGSYGFTTVFADNFTFSSGGGAVGAELFDSGSVGGGNHNHTSPSIQSVTFQFPPYSVPSSGSATFISSVSYSSPSSTGGGAAHYHSGSYWDWHSHTVSAAANLNVKYIDIILATKD